MRAFLHKKLVDMQRLIGLIGALKNVQVAVLLLRYVSRRSGFLERTVPSDMLLLEYAPGVDRAMCDAVAALVAVPMQVDTLPRLFLAVQSGGLGLHSVVSGCRSAYAASLAVFAGRVELQMPPMVKLRFERMRRSARVMAVVQELRGCDASVPPFGQPQGRKLQTILSTVAAKTALKAFTAGNKLLEEEMTRKQSPWAFAWLLAVPYEEAKTFTPQQGQIALARWLGLECTRLLPGTEYCGCAKEAYRTEEHMLRCGFGGGWFPRHDGVNDIVVELCKAAGVSVHKEVMHILPGQMRADSVLQATPGIVTKRTILDAMITTGELGVGVKGKYRKYKAYCDKYGLGLLGLIFGTDGNVTQDADGLFDKLMNRAPTGYQHFEKRPGVGCTRHHFQQLISVMIHRGTAAHLIQLTERCNGKAAHTPAPRSALRR